MNAKIFRLFGLLVISFFLVSCGADSSMQKDGGQNMKIWAHRGCSYAWPENTLQAFEAAAKLPVTGIELDIQLTKDGKIVVIHDETVDRTTDGSGNVRDFTLKHKSIGGLWCHRHFHEYSRSLSVKKYWRYLCLFLFLAF